MTLLLTLSVVNHHSLLLALVVQRLCLAWYLVYGGDDGLMGAETTLKVVSEYVSLFGCGSRGRIKTRFRRNDLPVPSHSSVYEPGSGP